MNNERLSQHNFYFEVTFNDRQSDVAVRQPLSKRLKTMKNCKILMEYIHQIEELKRFFNKPDFTDVKVFKGHKSLRQFIASMLSYYPWWIVMLYRVRKLLVSILGLVKHAEPDELPNVQPEDVPFTPGAIATFFIVQCAQEERFWVSETPEDKHLRAFFGVVKEPLTPSVSRFYVFTTVYYKHWTGWVYFNLIRPFHHLVVVQMARYALKDK